MLGFGGTNFLGDLAGKNQIGSDFYQDLELVSTRYLLNAGFRYYVLRTASLRASLSYGQLTGDDALTKEPFRSNRNIHFKSPIAELSVLAEWHIIKENYGKRYKIRGAKAQNRKFGLVGFGGIGVAYFNPKGQYFDGEWYNLKSLNTEGQGLFGGADPYSNFTLVFPLGFGAKYIFNRNWKMEVDFGLRKTMTDYIDDVSNVYFDKSVLENQFGEVSAYFSDPSLSPVNPQTQLWQTRPGERRGDPSDKDAYMFGTITLNYIINQRRGYRRIKKRRSVPSF